MPVSINGNTGVITGLSVGGLPDGTVDADSLASNAVTAGKLASGVGGKILQVVTTSTSTQSSTQSTSFSDNGLSLAITPSATSSKVLVMVNVGVQSYANTYNAGCALKILRDSTTIHTPFLTNEVYGFYHASSNTANMYARYPLTVLDSPNTTSSITYKTQHAALSTSHTTLSQPGGSGGTSTSYITLMEVGA
tara:strand:+ start:340 stop:918 length:579 start_codon:yes stop_codon:yes gene_type:complete